MFKLIRDNPRAFLIACVIHLVLIGFMSFSVQWHDQTPMPKQNMVKSVLIDDAKLKAEQEKKQKAEALKQKRAAEKKRELEKKKKLEAEKKHKAEQQKKKLADEKKRKAEQKKQKLAAEKKRKAEQKKKLDAEKKRLAEQERERKIAAEKKRKAEEERIRKETEARRAEERQQMQEQMAAEQARLEKIRQGELAREQDRYKFLIVQRIESRWPRPSGWKPGISCNVKVRLVPGAGTAQVIDVQITRSCGSALFDNSVKTAVYNASPLPFPTDPELISNMRNLNIIFKPEE